MVGMGCSLGNVVLYRPPEEESRKVCALSSDLRGCSDCLDTGCDDAPRSMVILYIMEMCTKHISFFTSKKEHMYFRSALLAYIIILDENFFYIPIFKFCYSKLQTL